MVEKPLHCFLGYPIIYIHLIQFNSIKTDAKGIGSASIAAIILITLVLVLLCIGGAMFYLKSQNMLCFAPHERDIGETEQEMQETHEMASGGLFFSHLEILFSFLGGTEKRFRCRGQQANHQGDQKSRSKGVNIDSKNTL